MLCSISAILTCFVILDVYASAALLPPQLLQRVKQENITNPRVKISKVMTMNFFIFFFRICE